MKTLDEVVADSPVFAGMDGSHLELIAGCGQTVGFAPGEYLCQKGEQADTFYLLRHGRVMLEMFVPGRGPLVIETIDEGEVVGLSWLFEPYRWRYDARALDLVRAVAFDGKCLRGKCAENHAFGWEFVQRFSQVMQTRLEVIRFQLLDVYGAATPQPKLTATY